MRTRMSQTSGVANREVDRFNNLEVQNSVAGSHYFGRRPVASVPEVNVSRADSPKRMIFWTLAAMSWAPGFVAAWSWIPAHVDSSSGHVSGAERPRPRQLAEPEKEQA